MKIYISGQISGVPLKEAQARFSTAEMILTEQGHEVVNPLKNCVPISAPWEIHIQIDIVLLIGCDAIYLLPDWNHSRGATLEKNIAELAGKQIIYEKTPVFVELKQAILSVMDVQFYEIVSTNRMVKNVYARIIYAHFCKEQGATITNIASEIRRNHSTIIYYLRKFEDEMKFNSFFREIVNKVKNSPASH